MLGFENPPTLWYDRKGVIRGDILEPGNEGLMEEKFQKLSFGFLPIPEEIMRSKALSFGAKFLFGIIAKTNLEHICFSVDYLAERMNCSKRETQRRIRELKENNLIFVIPRKGKTNEYRVNLELISLIQTPDQTVTPDYSGQGGMTATVTRKRIIIKENNNNIKDFLRLKEKLVEKMAINPKIRTEAQEIAARAERDIKAGKKPTC